MRTWRLKDAAAGAMIKQAHELTLPRGAQVGRSKRCVRCSRQRSGGQHSNRVSRCWGSGVSAAVELFRASPLVHLNNGLAGDLFWRVASSASLLVPEVGAVGSKRNGAADGDAGFDALASRDGDQADVAVSFGW